MVGRGQLEARIDPNFYTTTNRKRHQVIAGLPWRVAPFGKLAVDIFQGVGRALSDSGEYRLLKVKNIQLDGSISLDNFEPIAKEVIVHRKLLRPGDIIAPFIGEAIRQNKIALFDGVEGTYTIDNNTGVIRNHESDLNNEFLALFLRSKFGDWQVQRRIGGGGVPFLGTGNVRKLLIAIPPNHIQMMAITNFQNSRRLANELLSQANDLLVSIDDYLLAELGINLPPEPENTIANRIFTAQRRELAGWRFDPQALHPERETCIAELQRRASHPLRKVAVFRRDLRTEIPEGATYIGLENIETNTGRYLPSNEKETVSSAFAFRKGQVLFPKLRPYLNKVFLAPFDGLCSTEFHVLEGVKVRSEFLALFLRSQVVVKQTKHLMSGNTLPRLQTEDIEGLLIPKVDDALQEKIIDEAERRMTEAERLRQQAEAELEVAKRGIEAMVLGKVTP